jgi:uncharacterized Zn finger protein
MSELKQCPFCGCRAEAVDEDYGGDDIGFVQCTDCGARTDGYLAGTVSHDILIGEWNTRAPQSEWISVDDELPVNDDEFLVVSHGETRVCKFNPWRSDPNKNKEYSYMWFYEEDIPHYGSQRCEVFCVTYWMPMPTPPKSN